MTLSTGKPAALKIAMFLLAVLLLLALLWVVLPSAADQATLQLRRRMAEEGCIIHAGGFLTMSDGTLVSYTNSLEALEYCMQNGKRFCEIDLQETSRRLPTRNGHRSSPCPRHVGNTHPLRVP